MFFLEQIPNLFPLLSLPPPAKLILTLNNLSFDTSYFLQLRKKGIEPKHGLSIHSTHAALALSPSSTICAQDSSICIFLCDLFIS